MGDLTSSLFTLRATNRRSRHVLWRDPVPAILLILDRAEDRQIVDDGLAFQQRAAARVGKPVHWDAMGTPPGGLQAISALQPGWIAVQCRARSG